MIIVTLTEITTQTLELFKWTLTPKYSMKLITKIDPYTLEVMVVGSTRMTVMQSSMVSTTLFFRTHGRAALIFKFNECATRMANQ